jgi:type I restriction enzyme S subunit
MKTGWQLKRLEEVCRFQNGFAFKSNRFTEIGYPILRISNIQDEEIETRRVVYFNPDDYKENLEKYRVVNGDLLIAMSGATTGKIGFNTTDQVFYLNQRVGKFEPRQSISKQYLFYFLSTMVEESLRISAGSAQPNLSTEQIKNFEIPCPTLPEQQRIVGILDDAFNSIATAKANAEQNLQNARALFESHLQSVFTQRSLSNAEGRGESWVEKRLGEVYDVRDGTHDSPKYHATGFPLITSKNLKREGLSFEDVNLINEQDYAKINQRSVVHKGDVLFAMIGTIGNPTLVTVEPKFAIKNVALFKISHGQSGAFLKHYLASGWVISKMMQEAKGTTQKFVGLGYLRDFPINVPPLAKQLEVVERLDELSAETQRLKSLYQRKLAALDELKKSLLHQAFSGML